MTPTLEELDLRVRALERRSARHDEDIEAVIETVVETRNEVKSLSLKVDGLQGKVDGLEVKVDGLQEDVSGLKEHSEWTRKALSALLAHQGLSIEPDEPAP